MQHLLKTWPDFFWDIKHGKKNFDVRKDDRGFMIGDTLNLILRNPATNTYGEKLTRVITYKLDGGQFGIEEGYCVLGFDKVGVNS